MDASLVVHGHFYQPPRDNPWSGRVDRELSAYPWRDWNERITAECYRPNGFAKVLGDDGRKLATVNNYAHMSFDLGPTLAHWLQREAPETYNQIRDGDRQSVTRNGGSGNAIAQAYSHAILPLMTERDRRTQIRWGLSDFRLRFGRPSDGMWLPEAAVDEATLDSLIDEGVGFTILAPHQAGAVRTLGATTWSELGDSELDSTRPYRRFHSDGSDRFIDVFFYDSNVAREITQESLLSRSSAEFLSRFIANHATSRGNAPPLFHVATDGESYGHHTSFGDRNLAYALTQEAPRQGMRVSNYGAYLKHYPPTDEVRLRAPDDGLGTSWSCPHGLGRWTRHCGCDTGEPEWDQSWRAPLRTALDLLRDRSHEVFEELGGGEVGDDPWAARDRLIEWSLRPAWRDWLKSTKGKRALALLDMQLHIQLMYASCAWLHPDIGGLEARIALRHAARVIGLYERLGGGAPARDFVAALAEARSNRSEVGTGADIFRRIAGSDAP